MGERITAKKTRDSNIELLRVLCMIGIVANHYARHPIWDFGLSAITANRLMIQAVLGFGKLGVNCFILISGYYLVNKNGRGMKSLVKLWLQVLFYSLLIPLVFSVVSQQPINLSSLLHMFTPIISETWGFATNYFVMILLSPFLNSLANGLNQKAFKKMLLIMFALWSIVPTFTNHYLGSGDGSGEGVIWFLVMYLMGGYLRLYPVNWTKNRKWIILTSLSAYLFYVTSFIIMDLLSVRIGFLRGHELFFRGGQKVPMVVFSVSVFLIFASINLGHHQWINKLATATFGVFLIHEHPMMRNYLWKDLFHNADYSLSPWLCLHMITAVITVYSACTIIELLRISLLENRYMSIVDGIVQPKETVNNTKG